MIHAIFLAVVPLLSSTALSSTEPAAPARERSAQDEVPDKREDIKETLDTLGDHVNAKGEEDELAVKLVDGLIQEFKNCGPKDRAAIAKALDKAMSAKRRELEGDVPDNKLFLPVAVALREMAPESVSVLQKWIGHKQHKNNLPLQQRLILSLGYTKDLGGQKTLVKLLDDDKAPIQAAASEALGEFADADLKVRKESFEEMLKILMALNGSVQSDPADTIARERYDVISPPIITSLQRLSGQDIHAPDDWQRWWNKNKKKDWDDLG